jgi:hypothetical protein
MSGVAKLLENQSSKIAADVANGPPAKLGLKAEFGRPAKGKERGITGAEEDVFRGRGHPDGSHLRRTRRPASVDIRHPAQNPCQDCPTVRLPEVPGPPTLSANTAVNVTATIAIGAGLGGFEVGPVSLRFQARYRPPPARRDRY